MAAPRRTSGLLGLAVLSALCMAALWSGAGFVPAPRGAGAGVAAASLASLAAAQPALAYEGSIKTDADGVEAGGITLGLVGAILAFFGVTFFGQFPVFKKVPKNTIEGQKWS